MSTLEKLLTWLFGDKAAAVVDAYSSDTEREVLRIERLVFPRGVKDRERMVDSILAAVPGRLTREQAKQIGCNLKVMQVLVQSEDRSEQRLLASLRPKAPQLTEIERLRFVRAITGGVQELDGELDGTSPENPILIDSYHAFDGIDAEYRLLERILGKRDKDWTLIFAAHKQLANRHLEFFEVQRANGTRRTIYFDITNFFGR